MKRVFLFLCVLLVASPALTRSSFVMQPMLGSTSGGASTPPTPPTVDGIAIGNTLAATPTVSCTLTTIHANDLIVGLIESTSSSTAATGTAFTCGSITLTKHATYNPPYYPAVGGYATVEEWSGVATGTFSGTCSATLNLTTGVTASIAVFGVSGANNNTPWDTNSSLPAEASSTVAGATPTVSGVSTSHPNDLLIAVQGASLQGIQSSPGAGWIDFQPSSNGYGGNSQYQSVTTTQSSITVGFAAQGTVPSGYVIIAVATQGL